MYIGVAVFCEVLPMLDSPPPVPLSVAHKSGRACASPFGEDRRGESASAPSEATSPIINAQHSMLNAQSPQQPQQGAFVRD